LSDTDTTDPENSLEPEDPTSEELQSRASETSTPPRRGRFGRIVRGLLVLALMIGFVGPVLTVAVYRFVPPPITILMVQRLFEGQGFSRSWRSLDDISPHLVRSVIAAEDANFCSHHGFDLEAIRKALAHNESSDRVRGGSTISQQLAKNLFLSGERSLLRKMQEAVITLMLEQLMSKRRIFEIYLNVIEWGNGVFGAEAAARHYYGVSASGLNAEQAAWLAAIVTNPRYYDTHRVARRAQRKASILLARMPLAQVP